MQKKFLPNLELVSLPLKQVVQETLRNYFSHIGSERPANFYSILLEEVEKPLLEVLIQHTHYNQVKMANILGLSRGTLRKKLKQYGLLD